MRANSPKQRCPALRYVLKGQRLKRAGTFISVSLGISLNGITPTESGRREVDACVNLVQKQIKLPVFHSNSRIAIT